MAEVVSSYALTTLQRIKDRIFDSNVSAQPSAFDGLLTRMINSCSEWFERECGDRRFVQRLYPNEIYSATGPRQKRVVLRNAPVIFQNITGTTAVGSTTITGVSSTTAMVVGMRVMGDNIPAGATISSIGATSIDISAAPTTAVTGAYLQITGLIDLQWRAGTPSNPSWTDFIVDQYDLVNDGKAGVVRVYGVVPRMYDNMIRATYSAGYAVDWANAGDVTKHQLPAQISDTVENLVVRRFKRRQLAGKGSEALDGATTAWNRDLDQEDRDVVNQYRRMPTIF